ncbi:MAG: ATP-grasp domain-containing protein [Acidobacteriota bacterium]|nr:ATP-grasp domain-containing protein [Acidobacteriota bacterium]
MKSLNVLVTAASRRVPLVQAFRRAQRELGLAGSVVVTDVNPMSPAVYMADRAYRVSLSDDPGYPDQIGAICQRERIGLIVPTIDDELPLFGGLRPAFERMGVRVAASSRTTAELCNDKQALCAHLRTRGLPAVRTWRRDDLPADVPLPVVVKPRFGRGSVNVFRASTPRELAFFLDYVPDPVIQEYLPGAEYTIDMLCDFDGRPIAVVPRERVVIRSGVTDRGRTSGDRALIDLALSCAGALDFAGAVNIQCRLVDGRPVIFEINPRFSGGIPLTIAAGADFPRLLVELTIGRCVLPQIGRYQRDLWMTSYESSVFVPDGEVQLLEPHEATAQAAAPAPAA